MITLPVTTFTPYHSDARSSVRPHPTPKQWGKANSVAGTMSNMTEPSKTCQPSGQIRSTQPSKVTECPTESISFEVLYVGKLRMSYKRAPTSFIDDALEKFKAYESERGSKESNDSRRSSSQSQDSNGDTEKLETVAAILRNMEDETDRKAQSNPTLILTEDKENKEDFVAKSSFPHPLDDVKYSAQRSRNPSGDACLIKSLSLPVEPMRSRALSTGHQPRAQVLETSKSSSSTSNRTMILIVGRREMRIISPDAKQTLFQKNFKEIYQTARGVQSKDCFGFICRELGASGTTYVGYVFRCQSESVCSDILQVLKQASSSQDNALKKERELACDHCPIMWFHRLCVEIDGLNDEKVRQTILRRIDSLTEQDRENILMKFQGAELQSMEEQNTLLLMLVRAHCERKQLNHTHDTAENRHEFLQSYLGGGAILMKAKRSITSSFDQLMKRKEQQRIVGGLKGIRDLNALLTHHVVHQEMSPETDGYPLPSNHDMIVSDSPIGNKVYRPRSSTLGSIASDKIRCDIRNSSRRGSQAGTPNNFYNKSPQVLDPQLESNEGKHSPMMNIFLKVGPQTKSLNSTSPNPHKQSSWRQAIFKRVITPPSANIPISRESRMMIGTPVSSRQYKPKEKRSQEEIRELWKSAIRQQILLIRMEKQNHMLKAKQEETNVKRNKLSYREMGLNFDETTVDAILKNEKEGMGLDDEMLQSACIEGIPKQRRGQIWQLLIRHNHFMKSKLSLNNNSYGPGSDSSPSRNTPYEQLLRQLTSHQHAILIDLGRTFPSHPYFSSPLGSGQLALFNLLKAYSLLDPDVGYCQGLSFVAGVLLMHLEEDEAFEVLKYFMFDMGSREYYKADMSGLQVKLYQLNRAIYDHDADIHLLLYENEVLPSLYAAPWFLTMFASQFPIGFAVRVMDAAFVLGPDVMVKFALVLILDHKKELMECRGLENIMECFKTILTKVNPAKVDDYVRKVFELKIEAQLLAYATEYYVMHDETFLAFLNDPKCPSVKVDSPSDSSDKSKKSVNGPNSRNSSPITDTEDDAFLSDRSFGTVDESEDKKGLQDNLVALKDYIAELESVIKEKQGTFPNRSEKIQKILESIPDTENSE